MPRAAVRCVVCADWRGSVQDDCPAGQKLNEVVDTTETPCTLRFTVCHFSSFGTHAYRRCVVTRHACAGAFEASADTTVPSSSDDDNGTVVGAIVGGVVGFLVVVIVLLVCWKRSRDNKRVRARRTLCMPEPQCRPKKRSSLALLPTPAPRRLQAHCKPRNHTRTSLYSSTTLKANENSRRDE